MTPTLSPTEPVTIAYDPSLDRPGCVIVAGFMGCDTHVPNLFPADSWLLAPTDAMRRFLATPEQLAILVARVERRYGAKV